MTEFDLRAVARRLQQAALAAVDPAEAVYKFVSRVGDQILVADRSYNLREFDRVWLVGAGKAAVSMADAVSEVLRDRLSGGVIITKYQHVDRALPERMRVHEAGHPVPDQNSVDATHDLAALLREVHSLAATQPGARLRLTAPESLPGEFDADRIRQVLLNFVANAVFTSPFKAGSGHNPLARHSSGTRLSDRTVIDHAHLPGNSTPDRAAHARPRI